MVRTALQRQQEAERELWTLVSRRIKNRKRLSEATRSVFSTAELVARPESLGARTGSHLGFAERNAVVFREIMIGIVDGIRAGNDPKAIYRRVVRQARKFELTLTRDPWTRARARPA